MYRVFACMISLSVALLPAVAGGTTARESSRTKPHVNVGVLGQEGHGKAAVISAITRILSESGGATFRSVNEIRNAREERERGITIRAQYIEYETETRRYTHIYMPRHIDQIKTMIAGSRQMAGAILVVSSEEGATSQTKEQVRLASGAGINAITVYLNTVGDGPREGQLESIENEIRTLLSSHGYPGDDTPVVRGSAEAALSKLDDKVGKQSILDLLDAMDFHIPEPPQATTLPFLMPIEDIFSIACRGTVVTGRIERGIVKKEDTVEIVGLRPLAKAVVVGIEMFRKLLDQGEAGDNVGVLLRGVDRREVERGQVLAVPGSARAHTRFVAETYILGKDEGGRRTPFFNGYRPQFYFRTTDVTGSVDLPEAMEMVMPGENVKMTVSLTEPVALEKGLRFEIREGGRTVGAGLVVDVDESVKETADVLTSECQPVKLTQAVQVEPRVPTVENQPGQSRRAVTGAMDIPPPEDKLGKPGRAEAKLPPPTIGTLENPFDNTCDGRSIGFLSPSGEPPRMGLSGARAGGVYECRSDHIADIESRAFAPCDGQDGTGAYHIPELKREGSHRTEVRYRAAGRLSGTATVDYYVHHSLDGVACCRSERSDSEWFAAALKYVPPAEPFDDGTSVFNPFIRLVGLAKDAPYPVEILSLRRTFRFNPERTLVLIRRTMISRSAFNRTCEEVCDGVSLYVPRNGAPQWSLCADQYKERPYRLPFMNVDPDCPHVHCTVTACSEDADGCARLTHTFNRGPGQEPWVVKMPRQCPRPRFKIDGYENHECDAYVINRRGHAVCLAQAQGSIVARRVLCEDKAPLGLRVLKAFRSRQWGDRYVFSAKSRKPTPEGDVEILYLPD